MGFRAIARVGRVWALGPKEHARVGRLPATRAGLQQEKAPVVQGERAWELKKYAPEETSVGLAAYEPHTAREGVVARQAGFATEATSRTSPVL